MRVRLLALAVSASLWYGCAGIITTENCIHEAWRAVPKDSKVTVRTRDDGTFVGSIASIDSLADEPSLAFAALGGARAPQWTVAQSEMHQLQYRKAGKVQPLWVVLGFTAGLLGGWAFSGGADSGCEGPAGCGDLDQGGVALLSAIGCTIISTCVSIAFPSTRTIQCKR